MEKRGFDLRARERERERFLELTAGAPNSLIKAYV